jgi:hypothetical protein
MSGRQPSCPATREKVIDLYFMEHRAKLIDIAAFLDRFDRAAASAGPEDFRMAAFRRAAAVLAEGQPGRAKRILDLFSDPTADPIPAAPGKGACGAWPGAGRGAKPA